MPFNQRSLINREAWFPPCFVGQRIPQNPIFFINRKIIQNPKTQKRLEICQNQRYALQPEVSNPSGSMVSGWTKNIQKPDFFEKRKKSSKTQKLKNVQRYAKIRDLPFDQRSLIHREAWFPGEPRIPKNPIFFDKRKKSSKTQKFKNIQRYAKISDMPFNQRSLIHREVWFLPCFVRQNQQKKQKNNCAAILDNFQSIGPLDRCFL